MADLVFTGQPAGDALNKDAMPANKDLVIYRGDYVELFVTLKDDDGDPIDLTGTVPRAVMKETYESTIKYGFTCTLGLATGEVRIFMPTSLSTTLTAKSYIWDFEILDEDGNTRTYLTGDVTVYPEVGSSVV